MSRTFLVTILIGAALAAAPAPAALAAPEFVNGLTLPGDMLDESKGTEANTGRVGFFSDIYYDAKRNEWWGLSDRGPGGGTLPYETRVQRFKLDIDKPDRRRSATSRSSRPSSSGTSSAQPLNGIAPNPTSAAGPLLRPRRLRRRIRRPAHFLVSDEYGPSLYEFDRNGNRVRGLRDPGQPDPAQCRHGRAELRRRRPATPRASAPTAASRAWPSAPTARTPTRCCRARCWTRAAATASATASSSSTPRPGTAVAQYAYQMEGSSPGPRHLRAGGRQRSRVPRARAQQPRHRRRRGALAAEQEGLPHRPRRRDRRQPT